MSRGRPAGLFRFRTMSCPHPASAVSEAQKHFLEGQGCASSDHRCLGLFSHGEVHLDRSCLVCEGLAAPSINHNRSCHKFRHKDARPEFEFAHPDASQELPANKELLPFARFAMPQISNKKKSKDDKLPCDLEGCRRFLCLRIRRLRAWLTKAWTG